MENIPLFSLWKNISNKNKIIITIDGNTYASDDEEIKTISFLSRYDQFDVLFISSKDIEEDKLEGGFYRPEFIGKNEIEIKKTNASELFRSGFNDESIKNIFSIELIAAISIGDIAITKENIYSKISLNRLKKCFNYNTLFVGNLSECYSALRAWVNKQLKLTDKNKCTYLFSNWNSILFSIEMLPPHFLKAWLASKSINDEKYLTGGGTVNDYLNSLIMRVFHLLFTRDILEVLKINTYSHDRFIKHKNNYSSNMVYYFGYFLVLVTGILDTIGSIINWGIERKVQNYYETNLKKSSRYFKKFYNFLASKNNDLASYLESDYVQSFFELVYCLRNFVAHNIIPDRIDMSGNFEGLNGQLILLKGNIEKKILNYVYCNLRQNDLAKIGLELHKISENSADNQKLLDPVLFTRYVVKEVLILIDNIFNMLSLEKKMINKDEEIEKYNKIKKIHSRKGESVFLTMTIKIFATIETRIP